MTRPERKPMDKISSKHGESDTLEQSPTGIKDSEQEANATPNPQSESDETIGQLTKQVAKGGGIAFGGSIVGKTAGFGFNILLGRVLGPGAYGLYALGTSVTGIAQSVGSLGLSQGVIRFCSMYRGEGDNARIKGTIVSALAISLTSSILVGIILFVLAGTIAQKFFHEPALLWVLRALALALPFYVLAGITTSFAQSFRRIDYQQAVNNVFRPLVKLTLVGLAFLLGYRLHGVILGFIISGVLSAGLGFYFLWKIFPDIISRSKSIFEPLRLARFSIPMFLAGFCYMALHQTDRIMLGVFSTSSEVGIYSAASVLSQQLPLFFGAFVAIFLPMISDLYNKHQMAELDKLFKVVSRWIFITSLPLAVIVAVFSSPLMGLFGANFTSGWLVLVILALSQIVYFAVGPVGEMLQMTGRQDLVLANTVIMLLANIGLNMWLIPLWGKLGAAVATAISISSVEIMALIQVTRSLGMHPFSAGYIKPFGAAAVATAIGLGILGFAKVSVFNLIVAVASVLSIYIILVWVFGLASGDKMVLRAIWERIKAW